MQNTSGEVTELFDRLNQGDKDAESRLFRLVYKELRRLAGHYMRQERRGQSILPTELVHEAYVRLAGGKQIQWQGRSHFMAMAAICMRRVLIDRARKKLAEKHPPTAARIDFEKAFVLTDEKSNDLLALDEALTQLEAISRRKCRIVELRFFAGLEIEEIARLEGVSARTVERDWDFARAWLHQEIARGN